MTEKKELYIDEGIKLATFGIYEIDLVHDKWKMSHIVNELFGVPDDTAWSFEYFINTIVESMREDMREAYKNLIKEKQKRFSFLYKINKRNSGEERWIAGKGKLYYDENNRAVRIVGTNVDITEYKQMELKRLEQNMFLNTLLDAIPDFVLYKAYTKEKNGVYEGCNKAFEELVSISKENIIGRCDYDFNSKRVADQFREEDIKCLNAKRKILTVSQRLDDYGIEQWYEVVKAPYYNINNDIVGVISIGRNITEKKNMENKRNALKKKAEEYAYIDYLTKTNNRNYFNVYVDEIWQSCKKADSYVLVLDINKFKRINDEKGHVVGDEVLKEVGKSLNELKSKGDLVIRYGGDEFLVFLFHRDENGVKQYIEKLRHQIKKNCSVNFMLASSDACEISLAIGYTEFDFNKSVDEIIGIADQNMYKDKKRMHFLESEL